MTVAKLTKNSTPGRTPLGTKSKRVRTGCLTCRERHLKCDETLPNCMNCRKSNRACKRGIRLNFLDITVHNPSCLPPSGPWSVRFCDESRHIASEYRGGLRRYDAVGKQVDSRGVKVEVVFRQQNPCFDASFQSSSLRDGQQHPVGGSSAVDYETTAKNASNIVMSYSESQLTSPNHTGAFEWTDSTGDDSNDFFSVHTPLMHQDHFVWHYGASQPVQSMAIKADADKSVLQTTEWSRRTSAVCQPTNRPLVRELTTSKNHAEGDDDATLPLTTKPTTGELEFLRTADEVYYMQVYVEEVAIWMDAFDKEKHFSQLLPYRSLKSPVLLNALLACGVRHLALHDPGRNDTARFYYNTASAQLTRNRENPERNEAECSAAAVILKLYGHMSKKTPRQMSHVSGARVLMKQECCWNAMRTGMGTASFWLNVYLDVLSCLESDFVPSWHPDEWDLDMELSNDGSEDAGIEDEELWVKRIFYILARVAKFRLFVSKFPETGLGGEEDMTLESRLPQWKNLKQLCDKWNDACPRIMHPLGYMYPEQTKPRSLFPKVWLPKREAVFGRLLYHTAQCILTQTNPMEQTILSEEMSALQLHHAHEVCGIVAHTEDRGIGLIAIQSLTVASNVLIDHGEQMEVLRVLDRIRARSGWFTGDVERRLKVIWGWDIGETRQEQRLQSVRTSGQGRQEGQMAAQMAAHLGNPAGNVDSIAPQLSVPGRTGLSMPEMDDMKEALHLLNPAGFGHPRQSYQRWYEPPSQGNSLSSSLCSPGS